jgi:hypothetical protein
VSPLDDAASAAAQASARVTSAAPSVTLAFNPATLVTLVGTLAGAAAAAFGGPVTLAGMSIAQITGLAVGVANEAPAAIAAFEEIKALADGGTAPTAAQWAAWNAAADQATLDARAAEDRVIAGG